uniref:Cns1/TTC4 wheel domain-containing protein n=1 Tax=Amorphochlora amoebiformis TaxID=1561963 RepID=A0A7S0DRC5_9EUKA
MADNAVVESKTAISASKDNVKGVGRLKWPDNPEEIDEYLNQIPLFAKERPSGENMSEAWKMVEAMEAETDPKVKATNLKDNGNECFKAGPKRYKDALEFYQQALDAQCGDRMLEATILVNRALIHIKQENYGKAIHECREALKKNIKNLKAYCRAGIASLALGKKKEAMRWYEHGQKYTGDDFLKRNYVRNLMKKCQIEIEKELEKKEKAKINRNIKAKAEEMVKEAVKLRKLNCGPQTFTGEHKPKLDEKGCLHWPVLFLYPEFLQSDFVQSMHELRSFKEQLGQMFPPAVAPAPWDRKGNYSMGSLEIFVEVKGEAPHTVRRINIDEPLAEGLSAKDFEIQGVPSFMVVSRKSPYLKNFLSNHKLIK